MRAYGMRPKPLQTKVVYDAAQLELVHCTRDSVFSSPFDAAQGKRKKVTFEITKAKLAVNVFEVTNLHLKQLQLRQSRGAYLV